MAKNNRELRIGNVPGTGKKYRKGAIKVNALLPKVRPGRRKQAQERFVMPVGMSPLLLALFMRGGLYTPYNPNPDTL